MAKMKYFAHEIKNEHGKFDSKAEYEMFLYLKHQEDIGVISNLKRCTKDDSFIIIPKLTKMVEVKLKTKTKFVEHTEEQAATYCPDFTYFKDGKFVIHEQKSAGTLLARDYSLRRKLIKRMIADHNEKAGFEEWVFVETGGEKKKKKYNLK